MRGIAFIIVFITCTAQYAFSQERITDHNNDLWFLLHGDYDLGEKWGLDTELHLRLSDWGHQKQQTLIRPSVYYKYNSQVSFFLGYTNIQSYPYGGQPIAARTPENNMWIQALIKHKIGRIGVSHRYRFEERWSGKVSIDANGRELDGYAHKNRLRYRLTLKAPIVSGKPWYFQVFDEVWVNYGENTQQNIFDQNWLYAGIGRNLNAKTALEIAYQWQILNKSDGIRQESNNTIQLSFHYKINLKKDRNG